MSVKIYLYILILCGIWSQEIIEAFADKEVGESSNFLFRQKRVVSYVENEDVPAGVESVSYMVIIRDNGLIKCVGSILSKHIVITISSCTSFEASWYQVLSGSLYSYRGDIHNVTHINHYHDDRQSRPEDSIALLTVYPPFVYNSKTSSIPLYSEPLVHNILATVSGWGFNFRNANRGTSIPRVLRSIRVPILAHRDCVNRYRPHFNITENHVCTYHDSKHCGHTDGGAPLVIASHLAGVHVWTGPNRCQNNPEYPDVFIALQNAHYNEWIMGSIRHIEEQISRHHK